MSLRVIVILLLGESIASSAALQINNNQLPFGVGNRETSQLWEKSGDKVRYCYGNKRRSDILYNSLKDGLPSRSTSQSKKVVIIGAGISGLTAGWLLKKAGHDVTILESSDRVGGRIQTYRDLAAGYGYEVGAMRIPEHQRFVNHLIEKFNLKTTKFYNDTALNDYFINGVRFSQNRTEKLSREVMENFKHRYDLTDHEASIDPRDLFDQEIRDAKDYYYTQGQERFIEKYDQHSLASYLIEVKGLSLGAVQLIGLMTNWQGFMFKSLTEIMTDDCVFHNTEMFRVLHGHDQIPMSFLNAKILGDEHLGQEHIRYHAKVTELHQREHSSDIEVVVECNGISCYNQNRTYVAQEVILTTTAPIAFGIRYTPQLSKNHDHAMDAIHYTTSSKVIMVFHSPWWEELFNSTRGGTIVTDLPLTWLYYPSTANKNGYGILLASYTWGGDSMRMLGMSNEDIINETIHGLAKIHKKSFEYINKYFMTGLVKHWSLDPNTLGSFAGFQPYQFKAFQEILASPEMRGRLHFAGEHTETPHGWMDTSIHTGVRAAMEVHLGNNWFA